MVDNESKPLLAKADITDPSFLLHQGKVTGEPTPQDKIKAILWIFIGLPILFPAIPIALINVFVVQKFFKKDEPTVKKPEQTFPIFDASSDNIPYDDRQYDLIMFGASGFTGSLCVDFLVERYSQNPDKMSFRWAIAGRNRSALERTLNNSLTQYAPAEHITALKSKIDIIIADSNNVDQLKQMVRNGRSIVTTAGPFDKYGTNLVALCAAYGTHLSDITGESDWVRKMIDNYELQAKKSGAILTSHAGHDCIPWELACFNAAELLGKMNQKVVKFEAFDRINGNISGGTLATIIHSLQDRTKYNAKLGFDPLSSHFGKKSPHELKLVNQNFVTYDKAVDAYVGPFVMAAVMGNCVRRSCSINQYSSASTKATYHEKYVYNSIWTAIPNFLGLIALASGLFIPGVPDLLSRLLPPGTGPSRADQMAGYLLVQVIATGDKGGKTESWCYIPRDPGYYYTARMLVETGLVPILNKNQLSTLPNYSAEDKGIGGYWTPAAGTGPLIQTRLEDIGIQFQTRVFKKA